jgi:hypothetical protein
VHVLPRSFTNLPDAGVRPAPVASDDVSVLTENSEAIATKSMACLDEVPDGVDDPAINVELMLLLGEIANANGAALPIAGYGTYLTFRCTVCSIECIEHTNTWLTGSGARCEPVNEPACLLVFADCQERGDTHTRITRPRKAIVPVAHSSDLLGK